MRLVVASCAARYSGRLNAHLPRATRLLVVKSDGSVLLHSDGGSYKPLNWMSPPCALAVGVPDDEQVAAGVTQTWTVQHAKSDDRLEIELYEVLHDSEHELGVDPGLVKDGVEAHLVVGLHRDEHRGFGLAVELLHRHADGAEEVEDVGPDRLARGVDEAHAREAERVLEPVHDLEQVRRQHHGGLVAVRALRGGDGGVEVLYQLGQVLLAHVLLFSRRSRCCTQVVPSWIFF